MIMTNLSLLDGIRINYGMEKLQETFHSMVNRNKSEAVQFINENNLQFTTLYILQSEINKCALDMELNPQNRRALEIVKSILLRRDKRNSKQHYKYRLEDSTALKWILETGYKEDGINDQYDRVLEVCAIFLIKVHQDRSCLPIVVEMIFNRYRKGFFIYDLVWAFFESRSREALLLLANRLQSEDRSDITLARRLLQFVPILRDEVSHTPAKLSQEAIQWIKENQKFLRFTGESFLQTPQPCQYVLDMESKYLQKPVNDNENDRSLDCSEEERILLQSFQELNMDKRQLLSACSHRLYQQSRHWWKLWMRSPLQQQMNLAKRLIGGAT